MQAPQLTPGSSAVAQRPAHDAVRAETALLDAVVAAVEPSSAAPAAERLRRFLAEPDAAAAIRLWFGGRVPAEKDRLARRLNHGVAAIDRLLNAQLNAILHAPAFQRLEASWRGLAYLVERADDDEAESAIKVRVLNVSWRELDRDIERAIEFDQSQIFRKVYENEFGSPGGEPFGVLLGDYEIHPRPTPEHRHDDLRIVESLAGVAAAAFCPIILNVSPAMFGLDDFSRLEQRLDHERTFDGVEYTKWKSLRVQEDARFIGLTMPRVLMRTPYEDHGDRADGFRFVEDVRARDRSKYLWGGANYALGGVLIRAFADSGWLADIRGARRGVDGGGLVADLPRHDFATDAAGLVLKSATDVIITEQVEKQLSDLGFIPLCQLKDEEHAVFYSNQSLQKPLVYDRASATTNARMSAMLQYMFCVSRFAHYVKVLARDKLGAFTEYEQLERVLQEWIAQYVTSDNEASASIKARYPLRDAEVHVEPTPGKPGSYRCRMRLNPHYELDELQASVRVVAELTPARTAPA
ncbi:MAG: type VI secretion system contractile sheath large subunit [Planctomycetota bacterium]|nr:MAG: type VI secretion system contractile sheath large subunit [Planctomycetota bacterium]